jgi:hypothetical protein
MNYISWAYIDDAVHRFKNFLQDVEVKTDTYHVIFSLGTVISIDININKEFTGFDGSFMEEWPKEKINPNVDINDIFEYCVNKYRVQADSVSNDNKKALNCAYYALINDGYVNTDDVYCVPMEKPPMEKPPMEKPPMEKPPMEKPPIKTEDILTEDILWGVLWEKRNPNIYNLSIGCDYNLIIYTAIEFRKYDYMFPCVYAIITPDLKILRL